MDYAALVAHFVTPSRAAKALGVDRRSVNDWKTRRIPTKHQLKAKMVSGGKLKPDFQARREAREMATLLQARAA